MLLALLLAAAQTATPPVIRVNQLGYLPDAPKVAVLCALDSVAVRDFVVRDERGRVALGPRPARAAGSFAACRATYRLDLTALRRAGRYTVAAAGVESPAFRIDANVWRGAADTPLVYLRQQRSGFNPFFRDSVHRRDGIVVDDAEHPGSTGRFVPVSGGWADASDYLQYVTTSATATLHLMLAWRDHPRAFGDAFDARGLPGANGVPDALDEARHGLAWLLRMFPDDSSMFNQLGDDRDHAYLDLPTTDSSDYGWGKGKERPIYPCVGRPQGLFQGKNRSTGMASTAGKYASTFALAARLFRERDAALADTLRRRALAAYRIGRLHPGPCQTAPGRAPYFYEEESWADDMELAAAELFALTAERRYLDDALRYAAMEPVTPWMGADTASHYQWYPFHNLGHYELWRAASSPRDAAVRRTLEGYYRDGLERVARRAGNGFRVGIPFIWCSNDLMVSVATQALLYRRMTGDARFREMEQAALDWLLGANPWGTSMVVGWPEGGVWSRDPHSVVAVQFGPKAITGGLLDGPVYRSIHQNLRGIALREADEYAPFNTGFIVFHDDLGDYSTNEPIMDGTAALAYLLAAQGTAGRQPRRPGDSTTR